MGSKLDTSGQLQMAEPFQKPGPVYKKKRPSDRALIVSDGTCAKILDHIGASLDYWFEGVSREDCEDFDMEPPGIWIWEGGIYTSEGWTYYGYDYDSELAGGSRPLTKEEWELLKLNDCPWDNNDWLELQEPLPERAPPPTEESEETEEPDGPVYKIDCPQDRILYVSDGRQSFILAHIGPVLDEWVSEVGADLADEFFSCDPGVWVWEGTLVEDISHTPDGTEYDVGLSIGVTRLLTKEEWERWRLTEFPWDFANWWEPADESPDELEHV